MQYYHASLRTAFIALLLPLALPDGRAADAPRSNGRSISRSSMTYSSKVRLNINKISTVIVNSGILDVDEFEANSGLVYPKGSGYHTAVYESGFLWGADVNGEKRVGGSAYRTGLQPGRILSPGVAESPVLGKNRVYRVRPDYSTASLETELVEENLHIDTIRAHYERDWMEWPAAEGAPFGDADGDGLYNPSIDTPGVPGAGQTIWYVANDLDSILTFDLYGSRPLGIEAQVTVWAYDDAGALGQSFFRRYLLINKGSDVFDSMYVSPWSDPDVGTSTDDYVGCDTTMDLGFAYNSTASDAGYTPLPPPSVGFTLLRGPIVDSPGDTGVFNGFRVADCRNLGMTAFYYFARGDASVTDPPMGSYEGTLQCHNFFQGRIGLTGLPFTDPNTFQATPFALAGDPATAQGWVDGQLLVAGDRRLGLSSGPFTMAPGDTQEVIVGEILGGATPGVDRLAAIGLVRFYTAQIRDFFDTTFVVTDVREVPPGTPAGFSLSQNYPNPFNPVTTISYALREDGTVRLTVINVIGQEVAVLVDGRQEAGGHTVTFDAAGLPSGVYLYRITAGGSTRERKMLLMR